MMKRMTTFFHKVKRSTPFVLLSFALGFADVLSKIVVLNTLPYMRPVEIFGEYVRITLVMNPNTAFGISLGENFPYSMVAGVLATFVLVMLFLEKKLWTRFMYSLILGGAIGNITDRIMNGAVVDFIDIGIGNLRWFTFNLADVFVSLGIMGIIFYSFFDKNEGVRSESGVRERACNSSEGN